MPRHRRRTHLKFLGGRPALTPRARALMIIICLYARRGVWRRPAGGGIAPQLLPRRPPHLASPDQLRTIEYCTSAILATSNILLLLAIVATVLVFTVSCIYGRLKCFVSVFFFIFRIKRMAGF